MQEGEWHEDTQEEDGHVTGMMHKPRNVKNCWKITEARRGKGQSSMAAIKEGVACECFDLGLLASKTLS